MSDNVAEAVPSVDAKQGEWRELNEFAIVHPDGWTIARYTVMGNEKHMLWDPDGKAHGPFCDMGLARAAFRRFTHASKVDPSCTLLFL